MHANVNDRKRDKRVRERDSYSLLSFFDFFFFVSLCLGPNKLTNQKKKKCDKWSDAKIANFSLFRE